MSNDSTPHDTKTGSGGVGILAFLVGALVVALAVLLWFFLGGEVPSTDEPDVSIEVPGVGTVEGDVESE
ncbi:hypothetical protein HKCCE3408_05985 [Rhodobacterales bacterium HKCCE3408]|nr:hypothetical protein [Rhodobacterales bacterium HKCCE3408]